MGSSNQDEADKLMTDYQKKVVELYDLIIDGMDWDRVKTQAWMTTPNPLLGDAKPRDLIDAGRVDKLLAFVRAQIGDY